MMSRLTGACEFTGEVTGLWDHMTVSALQRNLVVGDMKHEMIRSLGITLSYNIFPGILSILIRLKGPS